MTIPPSNAGGRSIDVVAYEDGGDWPSQVNGTSIQLDPTSLNATDNDDGGNWCLSPNTETYGTMGFFGTPGAANVSCTPVVTGEMPDAAGEVIITELFPYNPSEDEFIEIHNPSATVTYDLNGCILHDSARPGNDQMITTSIELAPGAYVVISDDTETTPAAALNFGLNNGGDTPGIECGGTAIDVVAYTNTAPFPDRMDMVSIQLDPGSFSDTANDDGANWCNTPAGNTYGTAGHLGTPGAANVACP